MASALHVLQVSVAQLSLPKSMQGSEGRPDAVREVVAAFTRKIRECRVELQRIAKELVVLDATPLHPDGEARKKRHDLEQRQADLERDIRHYSLIMAKIVG